MSQMPGKIPPSMAASQEYASPLVAEVIGPGEDIQETAEARKKTRIILWVVAILGGSLFLVACAVASLVAMVYYSTGAPVTIAFQESRRVVGLPEFEARIGNAQEPTEIAWSRQLVAGKSLEIAFAQVGDKTHGRHTVRVENEGGRWVVTKSIVEFNDHTQIDFQPQVAAVSTK